MAGVEHDTTKTVAPVGVYVPLVLTFDSNAVTKAVAEIGADDLEDLQAATIALHETESYAAICGYFSETLGGGFYLPDVSDRWFAIGGLDVDVWVDVGLVPVYAAPESAMSGIHVVARMTLLGGPHVGGAHKTVLRFFDDERGLRGKDPSPLATILSIGRNVADCLTAEMAVADKFDASRRLAAEIEPEKTVEAWRHPMGSGEGKGIGAQGLWAP
ncbi:hypothetical protein [Mycobacteroides salmoniphilum]|uniref:Uncharacterized protein n=1 Tax=Mycobacteroides salmoniphilum TaxID=404941 RepID=A0A4R8SZZ5_9MYCO|nr:hypothetical protein [Mycobacteroides salmoniphilum]TEA09182.1 hypothetical protein CCUG60884_00172 [Mycobacteroides salmoniphilum]